VTFLNVPQSGFVNSTSFQMEMFFDGAIRITYLKLDTTGGLAGLSAGTGVPRIFLESDLSSYGFCMPASLGAMPSSATEGDGTLAGQGSVRLLTHSSQRTSLSVCCPVVQRKYTVPATATNSCGANECRVSISASSTTLIWMATQPARSAHRDWLSDWKRLDQCRGQRDGHIDCDLPANTTEGAGTVQGSVTLSAFPAANIPR
jgi:hypothetical protein